MKITNTDLNRLTRWELFQFLAEVLTFAENQPEGLPELFTNKLAELKTAYRAFDEALVQEEKVSPEFLFKAEEDRDYTIRKIYNIIKEYSNYRFDEEKEDAAIAMLRVFKPYGTGSQIAIMAQDTETAVLTNLIQDFQKEGISAHLTILDLLEAVSSLELYNSKFQGLQHNRLNEDSKVVTGIVKAAREDAQTTFLEFVDIINALAIVEGAEKYADMKHAIKSYLKIYTDRAKQRTKKTEEETPEEVTQ